MKKSIAIFLLTFTTFAACKKEHIPGTPSVNLSLTTFYKNGAEETRSDRTGKIEKNSSGSLINDGTGEKYLVNLGSVSGANSASFGISFLFENKRSPETINSTYTFPQDQLQLRVTLRNDVMGGGYEILTFPTRGKISFSYDSSTKKINGSVQSLEFSIVPNDPYGRYRVTADGGFRDIPVY